jgi:2,3-diketo-5-methylthio-1-phosphopentane phosphatase
MPIKNLSDCIVFFDFDNTITPFDVLDDIIKCFSINKDWVAFEESWRKGKISSRECLKGQLRSVRVTKKNLLQYLSKIKLDSHFPDLLNTLRKKGIDLAILSDSFSFIIENILRNNGIKGLRIYSNRLRFNKDRMIPLFPHFNKKCPRCANCKTRHLSSNGSRNKRVVYIGDGLSDVCPAENADFVFAKDSLLKHFNRTKRRCVAFRNMGDIYQYFRG